MEATKFTSDKNWDDTIRIAQEAWLMFKELQNNKEARYFIFGIKVKF